MNFLTQIIFVLGMAGWTEILTARNNHPWR